MAAGTEPGSGPVFPVPHPPVGDLHHAGAASHHTLPAPALATAPDVTHFIAGEYILYSLL